MKDIYHSHVPHFAALFAGYWFPHYWAVTFGQTTWWTVGPEQIWFAWRAHEDTHKAQFARDGKLRFVCRYVWEWFCGLLRYRSFRRAYAEISYEREARETEIEV